MTTDNRTRLSLIVNNDIDNKVEQKDKPTDNSGRYTTNPMYEKLIKFKLEQQRKRFTVEDLLKW
ncbi:MAG: hypothetical protein MJ231_04125 [bacterium]|nr:hypothetical protein [bacterium]